MFRLSVAGAGLEPARPRALAYEANQIPTSDTPLFGAGSRIRTDDLEITNHPLYQLSYSGKKTELNKLIR